MVELKDGTILYSAPMESRLAAATASNIITDGSFKKTTVQELPVSMAKTFLAWMIELWGSPFVVKDDPLIAEARREGFYTLLSKLGTV